MNPCGTGITTENWDALSTVTVVPSPFSLAGTLVATGATDMEMVEPCTAVEGTETAVSSSSTTELPSTAPPKYWLEEGV